REFFAVLLHEAAHVLTEPDGAPLQAAELAGIQREIRAFAMRPQRRGVPLWDGHGAEYSRAALHLIYRASRLGVFVEPHQIVGGMARYGLSHGCHFVEALGDEPAALADLPIGAALARPPPRSLLEFWQSQLEMYDWLFLRKRKPKMSSAILRQLQEEMELAQD